MENLKKGRKTKRVNVETNPIRQNPKNCHFHRQVLQLSLCNLVSGEGKAFKTVEVKGHGCRPLTHVLK